MSRYPEVEWNVRWPWFGIIAALIVFFADVHLSPGYAALLLFLVSGRYGRKVFA